MRAVGGFDGDDDLPFAGECAEVGAAVDGFVSCHRTHLEVMRALRDQQGHETLALQLQRERAVELERGGEQHHRGDGLAEQLLDGGWIGLVFAQLQPRPRQAHGMTADGMLLEYESPHPVCIWDHLGHGPSVSPDFRGSPAFSSAAH